MMDLPFAHYKQRPLREHTSFGIGGPARYLAEGRSVEQIIQMLDFVHKVGMPFFILGKGSNVLFNDKGFDGLVILNKLDHLHEGNHGLLHVGSGYSFARMGKQSTRKGWSGLEFASGIPATVGGALYMNAGANGQQTADSVVQITYLTQQGEIKIFSQKELQWGYRFSMFQQLKGMILAADFQLTPSDMAHDAQRKMLSYRLKTQPYKDKSAGCAFRNPIGYSAGALIEQCGLKGLQIGAACVSSLHANFIVNLGGASALDVLTLMDQIKEVVFEKKGILLEEEIRLIR